MNSILSIATSLVLLLPLPAYAGDLQRGIAEECRNTLASFHEKIIREKSVNRKSGQPVRGRLNDESQENQYTNFGTILKSMSELKDVYCGFGRLEAQDEARNDSIGGGGEGFLAAGKAAKTGKEKVHEMLCAKRTEFLRFEAKRKLDDMIAICTDPRLKVTDKKHLMDLRNELKRIGAINSPSTFIALDSDPRFLKKVENICRHPKNNPCSRAQVRIAPKKPQALPR